MGSYVELSNICKNFNHIKALDNASLKAWEGEVLAIVGDNGAGKSTLIKILSGVLRPDSGKIRIGQDIFKSMTVESAIKAGVSVVYQDLALGDTMDVSTNIFAGHELTKFGFLNKKEMHKRSTSLINRLGINIPDTHEIVGNLSGGQRQGVAVARLVNQGGHIMIFDEPTAAMGLHEATQTLKLITKLANEGMAVIVICHNLQQVFQIADRIAVMRHGNILMEEKRKDLTIEDIMKLLLTAE